MTRWTVYIFEKMEVYSEKMNRRELQACIRKYGKLLKVDYIDF